VLKKGSAILLLLIFLFNIAGYRLLLNCLESAANTALENALDHNDYNERDLVTIKVSLNLPYQTDWPDFERVDGKVEFDGRTYTYVKRKIADGQLILMCLPNEQTTRLEKAGNDFFKLANDLAGTPSGKTPANNAGFAKAPSGIYDVNPEAWRCTSLTQVHAYQQPYNYIVKNLHILQTPEQPPDMLFI